MNECISQISKQLLEANLFVSISLLEAIHLDEFLRDCAKPENQITPVQFFYLRSGTWPYYCNRDITVDRNMLFRDLEVRL